MNFMKPTVWLMVLALGLCGVMVAGVLIGCVPLSLSQVWQALVQQNTTSQQAINQLILLKIRIPRVLVAVLVGAGLSVAGCVVQSLFHNPLASPGLLGAASGGSLGAVLAIVCGWQGWSIWALPMTAIVGALLTLVLVYGLATRHGHTPIATLLLAGVAVSGFLSAIISLLLSLYLADHTVSSRIVGWLMGDLANRTWEHVFLSAPLVVGGLAWAWLMANELNIMLMGDETALGLGVSVQRCKLLLLVLTALLTGASVAVAGVIGFVGLIIPHLFRLLVGPDNRILIPVCALGGGAFLVLMDLLSRALLGGGRELHVGVLTSLVGAPFFIYLLLANRKKSEFF